MIKKPFDKSKKTPLNKRASHCEQSLETYAGCRCLVCSCTAGPHSTTSNHNAAMTQQNLMRNTGGIGC